MNRNFPVPSGTTLRCRGWRQEGLLRLLENVLAVGEDPENLVVYAALGKAARDWPSHDRIVDTLKTIEDGETLLVQSGKPIGVIRTHAKAPVVVMANCNMVGQWAKAEKFYELAAKNLICWGGLTAGDWQYIGSQGVIQGTYEIFMRIAARHFGGDLAGRFVLTAGLGGMGGAQPLAGKMAEAAILCVEVDAARIEKRIAIGYLDARADTLDAALAMIRAAQLEKKPLSVGLCGNAADIYPELRPARNRPRRRHGSDLGPRPRLRLRARRLFARRGSRAAEERSDPADAGIDALDRSSRLGDARFPTRRRGRVR